jgi:ABC-2 type transport system ATP-binding protein
MINPSQSAIAVRHISKSYGEFRAVADVSFEVFNGEIFAMLGPNGAGKSTTIRMILDILKPDSGTIEVLGGAIDDARKDRIGYLPEERGSYRTVPVLDMMIYLAQLKGVPTAEARKRAQSYLERLSLADFAKKKVSELSKGMQQKIQFAVTLIHQPDLIIIDEPFSGLDPVNTLIIQEMLLDFKREGGAIVMSTHQMSQVEELADRLFMINRGQQALYGEVREVRQQYALHAVIVEGEGDWARLPSVERVESNADRRMGTLLYLKPAATADDLLSEIAADPTVAVRKFEMAVPSLNDIFINVANGSALTINAITGTG